MTRTTNAAAWITAFTCGCGYLSERGKDAAEELEIRIEEQFLPQTLPQDNGWMFEDYSFERTPFGEGVAHTQLSVGAAHLCAIGLDAELSCFGRSYFGETHPPPEPWAQVWTGNNTTCARRPTGELECWGNIQPDRGLGLLLSGWPMAPAWEQLAFDHHDVCGLDADGMPHCLSHYPYFSLEGIGPFVALDMGGITACGLTEAGEITCWTSAGLKEFDDQSAGPWVDLHVLSGGGGLCATRSDGSYACWGNERSYTYVRELPPANAPAYTEVRGLGSVDVCGRDLTGRMRCLTRSNLAPPPEQPLIAWDAHGQSDWGCGLDAGGVVRCWGEVPVNEDR